MDYPTGVTLDSGDSMTFTVQLDLTHTFAEVAPIAFGGPGGKPELFSPADGHVFGPFTCEVTGE